MWLKVLKVLEWLPTHTSRVKVQEKSEGGDSGSLEGRKKGRIEQGRRAKGGHLFVEQGKKRA